MSVPDDGYSDKKKRDVRTKLDIYVFCSCIHQVDLYSGCDSDGTSNNIVAMEKRYYCEIVAFLSRRYYCF